MRECMLVELCFLALRSGARPLARARARAHPPGGSSAVVCGKRWVHFHPLRPVVRIFSLCGGSGPSTSPFPCRKSWLPARDKVDLYPFDQREARSAYAGTNLRFCKSTETSTYVVLAFHLSTGRAREKSERKRERDAQNPQDRGSQTILFPVRWAEMPGVMQKGIHVDATCHGTST